MRSQDEGCDTSPTEETRESSSHVPIRAERSTPSSHALPPDRDETIRPRYMAWSRPLRQRPLNRETLSDRPALLPVPQRATNRPEQPIERGEQKGEARPEENDARVDDEPLHREVADARAGVTTTREPVLGAHAARVVEGARERDAVAESHFRSDLSGWTGWYVVVGLKHTQCRRLAQAVRGQSGRVRCGTAGLDTVSR